MGSLTAETYIPIFLHHRQPLTLVLNVTRKMNPLNSFRWSKSSQPWCPQKITSRQCHKQSVLFLHNGEIEHNARFRDICVQRTHSYNTSQRLACGSPRVECWMSAMVRVNCIPRVFPKHHVSCPSFMKVDESSISAGIHSKPLTGSPKEFRWFLEFRIQF